jgi:histone H3/H4
MEALVVVSKVKAYVKTKGDMNTSAETVGFLTEKVQSLLDKAIVSAKEDGRKTVMARDFKEETQAV